MAKEKFDINNYPGNYAMHVRTEEEAECFCKYLDSQGRQWRGGTSYLHHTSYRVYGNQTCYDFNAGMYGDVQWFEDDGADWTILEFSDFDWSDAFKEEEPVVLKFSW